MRKEEVLAVWVVNDKNKISYDPAVVQVICQRMYKFEGSSYCDPQMLLPFPLI